MRWKEKEKKNCMVGMRFLNTEEGARAEREKWMDHQDHEVMMLNISIIAEKLNSDRLVEEHRTSMEMFWKCWDRGRSRGDGWGRSSGRRSKRSLTERTRMMRIRKRKREG